MPVALTPSGELLSAPVAVVGDLGCRLGLHVGNVCCERDHRRVFNRYPAAESYVVNRDWYMLFGAGAPVACCVGPGGPTVGGWTTTRQVEGLCKLYEIGDLALEAAVVVAVYRRL